MYSKQEIVVWLDFVVFWLKPLYTKINSVMVVSSPYLFLGYMYLYNKMTWHTILLTDITRINALGWNTHSSQTTTSTTDTNAIVVIAKNNKVALVFVFLLETKQEGYIYLIYFSKWKLREMVLLLWVPFEIFLVLKSCRVHIYIQLVTVWFSCCYFFCVS